MSEQELFRLRVRYSRRGRLRYLGHLEVVRTIERVVRRAGLPYAVTQGFSPHMRVSFSSALPVGTASRCEWYDLVLTSYVPADRALDALAAATPDDLAPSEARYIDMRSPALTAWLTHAEYEVRLWSRDGRPLDPGAIATAIDGVRSEGGIDYLRGRKTKRLDLDRTLAGYSVEGPGEDGCVSVVLDARMDNEGALRPEILIKAIDARLGEHGSPAGGGRPISIGPGGLGFFGRVLVTRTAQGGDDVPAGR